MSIRRVFSIFKLAFNNVIKRKNQSLITIAITAISVFTLLMTFSTFYVVKKGVQLSNQRIGADVLVIASNSEFEDSQFLYSSKPTTRYIAMEDLAFINNYNDEIDTMTEQFFTHTLKGGCCSVGETLRIVGINQETDFLIRPWLEEQNITRMADNQALIGDDVIYPLGARMGLLGHPFNLVGSLYRTGTGMDRTIFMDIHVARKLAKERIQKSVFKGRDTADLATSLYIRLKPGVNARNFADKINAAQDKVMATAKADTISKIEDSIYGWIMIVLSLILAIVLNCLLSLFGRFNGMMKERKKEIGYLRSFGVPKIRIFRWTLMEIGLLSLTGGVIASLSVLLTISPVLERISRQFTIPNATLSIPGILIVFVLGPVSAFALGVLSGIIPVVKSVLLEPREAMARGDV